MAATIKFNVGGRRFEVARALIDGDHSETMLGKIVSDSWLEDPEKTVFIDRDGDIFACVLNHLRCGDVDLPVTIPRRMFWRELDYYGIVAEETNATDEGYLAGIIREYAQPVETAKRELARANRDFNMFALAYECHCQFHENARHAPEAEEVAVRIGTEHILATQAEAVACSDEERELLEEILGRHFGLAVSNSDVEDPEGDRILCVRGKKPLEGASAQPRD